MEENLDSSFRAAAENCKRCYDDPKQDSNVFYAQKCLNDIMGSYDEKDKNWKLAHNLMIMCNSCGFRDSKIKNTLEGYGIMI